MKKISFRKKQNLSVLVAAAMVSVLISSSCQAMPFFKEKLPTTPYALPIDISKKGNKAEIALRIKSDEERKSLEPTTVAFEVKFAPYDPRQDKNSKYYPNFWRRNFGEIGMFKKYFRDYTKEEKDEIWKDHRRVLILMEHEELISSGTGATYKSQWIKHKGIPIPNIRLTITDLNDPNKKVVYDEVLEVKKNNRVVSYFMKSLTSIKFDPGTYRITAEVQSDAVEFGGVEVLLIIGSYRAKI